MQILVGVGIKQNNNGKGWENGRVKTRKKREKKNQ